MPRTYIRRPGSRRYVDYSEQTIEALNSVAEGEETILGASRKFNIPYGTLHNRYKGQHGRKPGGQPALLASEEKAIVACIIKCAYWGFPLSKVDVQLFFKVYIQRVGKTVRQFKNGCYPGKDWVDGFMTRHSEMLSLKVASNIKRSRASVSRETLTNYFDNLQNVLIDIPASNVYNYDETNVSDDPGKNKMIFRRGTKYPEKICNFSKSATTIMFCGAADGTLLPPYVIYRSEHLWDTWIQNGHKGLPCCNQACCSRGSRFNRTKSGWIDASTFADWFESVFLPHAKRQIGRKVLIGDNLSSHLFDRVIELCSNNDIDFVCLPSNSTHICQPLDVSFFKALKTSWRKILIEFKVKNPKVSGIPKESFPSLLSQCIFSMDKIEAQTKNKAGDNQESAVKRVLINGFEACGILPFNPSKVVEKTPKDTENDVESLLADSLTTFLKEQRFSAKEAEIQRKKKRIQVEAGKSISAEQDKEETSCETDVDLEDSASSISQSEDSEETNEVVYMATPTEENLKVGEYVLVKILSGKRKSTNFRYVVRIQDVGENEFEVVGMKSVNSSHISFRMVEEDIFLVNMDDILAVLPHPTIEGASDRRRYNFNGVVDVKDN